MELNEYVNVIRKRWTVILAGLLAGALLGAFAAMVSPKTYTASAGVLVTMSGPDTVSDLNEASAYTTAQMPTYAALITTPVVLDPVIQKLGLEISAAELAQRISAAQEPQTALIDITAEAATAEEAAAIAQEVATTASTQVTKLSPGEGKGKGRIVPQMVRPATAEGLAPSPSLKVFAILGTAVGGLLGLVLAVIMHATRTRKESRRRAE